MPEGKPSVGTSPAGWQAGNHRCSAQLGDAGAGVGAASVGAAGMETALMRVTHGRDLGGDVCWDEWNLHVQRNSCVWV